MLLFLVLCPIAAAVLIIAGAPARLTALVAAISNLFVTLLLLSRFDQVAAGFQFVSSLVVSAVWFAGRIDNYERAFYACLLFISAGAIGAFASIDLFFFYAFHELALIPTFLLIGIWGTGNRVRAAWKITIYLSLGSFILLIGLILLYQSFPPPERSFDIRHLQEAAVVHAIAGPE